MVFEQNIYLNKTNFWKVFLGEPSSIILVQVKASPTLPLHWWVFKFFWGGIWENLGRGLLFHVCLDFYDQIFIKSFVDLHEVLPPWPYHVFFLSFYMTSAISIFDFFCFYLKYSYSQGWRWYVRFLHILTSLFKNKRYFLFWEKKQSFEFSWSGFSCFDSTI